MSMRRVIAIALAGGCLAGFLGGCSSMSSVTDYFKSTPTPIQVQLESQPPGADARTSLGPGCKTPCSVSVAPPDAGFTVTYALPKFQSATIPVQVLRNPGDLTTPATTTINPNPVFAQLAPIGPPPKAHGPKKKKKPKPAAPDSADSPFPDPGAQQPPPGSAR
jgi:hypothetical protein